MSVDSASRAALAPEAYEQFLAKRRADIMDRVLQAARRASRSAEEVSIIAVSKTVGIAEVAAAWRAGWHAFGENRPQELARKIQGVAEQPGISGVRFDMIGNLQTNKINQVLECGATLIHSVSSKHLAQAISKRARVHELVAHALLEVNVSGEESKNGFAPDEVRACVADICELPSLDILGLMAMAPEGDADAARRTFSGLRELRDILKDECSSDLEVLSCGMSEDFEIAVEEGATLLRLGRVVFDPNQPLDWRSNQRGS